MNKHVKTQKTWTPEEDQFLMSLYKIKIPLKSIAIGMGRTHLSISDHITEMREAGTWTEGRRRAPRKQRIIDPVLTEVARKLTNHPVMKQQEIALDFEELIPPDRGEKTTSMLLNDMLVELKKINLWLRSDSDLPERFQ